RQELRLQSKVLARQQVEAIEPLSHALQLGSQGRLALALLALAVQLREAILPDAGQQEVLEKGVRPRRAEIKRRAGLDAQSRLHFATTERGRVAFGRGQLPGVR